MEKPAFKTSPSGKSGQKRMRKTEAAELAELRWRLQIENAIEAVRTRSLKMKRSDELAVIAALLFKQFEGLNMLPQGTRTFFSIFDKKSKSATVWMTQADGSVRPGSHQVPLNTNASLRKVYDAWKRKTRLIVRDLSGRSLVSYLKFVSSLPHASNDKALGRWISHPPKRLVIAEASFSHGTVGLMATQLFTKEALDTLKRAAGAFELTYTRFLDLQKAEVQNRATKTQLALAKVRTRTMAMQRSDELSAVATILFDQLRRLGGKLWTCGFVLCHTRNPNTEQWLSLPDRVMLPHFEVPRDQDMYHQAMFDAWRKRKKLLTLEIKGRGLKRHYELMFKVPVAKDILIEMSEKGAPPPSYQLNYAAPFRQGYFLVVTTEPYPEVDLFKRFAMEFEQIYSRFLDLKKAEAQAREAKIEAALEKVRARAMSMRSSSDLAVAVSLFFGELKSLKVTPRRCGVSLIIKGSRIGDFTATTATEDGHRKEMTGKLLLAGHPVLDAIYDHWVSKKEYHPILRGDEIRRYYKVMNAQVEFPDFRRDASQFGHYFFFREGFVFAWTQNELKEEELQIFRRFTSVLSLTYRRYMDLQKAEAQAREAEIQLALERIRARTMAMHSSDELLDAATVLFQQLQSLGLSLWTSGFALLDRNKDETEYRVANPEGQIQPAIFIPNSVDRATRNMFEHWLSSDRYYVEEAGGKQLIAHYDYLLSLPKSGHVFRAILDSGIRFPQWQQWHAAYFSHGYIMIITTEPHSDDGLLQRFASVFNQTYTRYLDLKEVEKQAREAQIETALERVRSRTMAMHRSDDLAEVANVIHHQLRTLTNLPERIRIAILVMNPANGYCEVWVTGTNGAQMNTSFRASLDEPIVFKRGYQAWKAKEKIFTVEISGDDWIAYRDYLKEISFPIDDVVLVGKVAMSGAYFSDGFISLITPDPLPDEALGLLGRFAGVFDLTYRRFLDLQKAEAQAREAEIQLALERVRAKTMSMQNSTELADASFLMANQIRELGIKAWGCAFHIYDDNEEGDYEWFSNEEGFLPTYKTPRKDVFKRYYDVGQSGRKLYIEEFAGEACVRHYNYLMGIPIVGDALRDLVKSGIPIPSRQIDHVAFFKHGYLLFITYESVPEAYDIFKRFAREFEQTYTRFLDLQKAEAQAREAQIETALERIRSRTMAMQKSDELSEVASLLFQQIGELGIKVWTAGFNVWLNNGTAYQDWITSPKGGFIEPYIVDTTQFPVFIEVREAKQRGDDFFVQYVGGEMIKAMYGELSKFAPRQFEVMLRDGFEFPKHQYDHFVFGSTVSLMFITFEPLPEAHDIFKRFGKVFEQTYTRFLDLQKAEAQAGEAQIEAALERVRARAMAMHHSTELNEILVKLFAELKSLELEMERCVIWIYNPEDRSVRWWAANPEADSGTESFLITDQDHPVYHEYWKAWEERRAKYLYILEGDNMVSWCDVLFYTTELGRLPQEVQVAMRAPNRVYLYNTFNDFGVLFLACLEPLSDDKFSILERFGKVFDQSYTRFQDIQKAEAREKEAIKQSSLDRIRAEIASMRTADDLQHITPLIWKELHALNVPFIRCGVFIMDEQEKQIQNYLSTPEGEAIAAFQLSYDTPGFVVKLIDHWRNKRVLLDHWDEAGMKDFADILVNQRIFDTPEQYLRTLPKEGFYLHLLPFLQGMLYVGNMSQLGNSELNLLQSLANAFSTAYARYDDFNRLGSAMQQIEKTLVELRQAQQQLIQSEKMASLGELTAGIAHEIKNPLNFVNNFSEVTNELIDELTEEIAKGNAEEVANIAGNVKQNLEKIVHHGRRADAIVKGMLQHSRSSSGLKELTDLNALADEYLRLAYHGLRAKDKSFSAAMKTDFDETLEKANVISQDIGRVILNLITNAFYAVTEKKKEAGDGFEPVVVVGSKRDGDSILISVKDNGSGIPQNVLEKIFQPFFTTKPTGQGTGLGLSLSYDIVKAHGGEIWVETKEGEGTTFILKLTTTDS